MVQLLQVVEQQQELVVMMQGRLGPQLSPSLATELEKELVELKVVSQAEGELESFELDWRVLPEMCSDRW